MGVVGDKKAVPALIHALQGKFNRKRSLHLDTDLRGKAAGALGLIKAKTAIPVLIEILTNQDKEYVLRHYYIPFALGEIGDPSAIEHLESILKEEGMPKHKIKKAIAKLKKIQQNGEKEE